MKAPALYMGACRVIQQAPALKPKKGAASPAAIARTVTAGETEQLLHLPAHHLTTHFITVGASGCGKTALGLVTAEEAMRASIPVLMIDVKGDLPNLLLSFPDFEAAHLEPWVAGTKAPGDTRSPAEVAQTLAAERRAALESWQIGEQELHAYHRSRHIRLITPGSSAGEGLHVLSALERYSARWENDPESALAALTAAVSLLLRLVGEDADPARSRPHVYLSLCAERRLRSGGSADIGALIADLEEPPIDTVGVLPVDRFLPKKDRQQLAASLNSLLASPSFSAWRTGASLDLDAWLEVPKPTLDNPHPRAPGVIVSVAHLDDEERTLVLGVLLEELLTWVRSLPGSQSLRALVIFDEVYGFLPPHPANPPTKRPLVALMKQARAFGVGIAIGTQNPMDLDYRSLGNAGIWCIGRLQTDADRERVIDGLLTGDKHVDALLDTTVNRLVNRWFVLRNVRNNPEPVLFNPRYAVSHLRGPMTRVELQRALALQQAAMREAALQEAATRGG